ncbi:MAG: metalloregulator ArsR/SmtB family transcription factor [Acetobacteraceae bacterium]
MPDVIESPAIDLAAMASNARLAARFLKALAHEQRLLILCHLAHGERSVGELELRLGMRQAHLSQQLARLRQDGLVRTRRASRTIYYRLGSAEAEAVIAVLYARFCNREDATCAPPASPPAPADR